MKKIYSGLFLTLIFALHTSQLFSQNSVSSVLNGITSTTSNAVCSCIVPLDSGFVDVPFSGSVGIYHSCDDGSFGPVALPFVFCYYGDSITSVYINNNGNVSFGNPYLMFVSSAFPNTNYNMITPFWADIDTRSNTSASNGRVRYKITPTSLIVKWDSVGHFPMQGAKRNSFQLTLTDGIDTLVPGLNNVSFCYGDMQWTGGGTTGFSGTPSTTGVNKGDSTNYFQITRCNHDSTDYDGPYGNHDGISYLDGKSFFISTCTGGGLNVPPVAINTNCDTIILASQFDSTLVSMRFIGPEFNQVVTAQLLPNPNAVVVSSTSGVDAVITIKVFANATGIYPDLEIIATDNVGATTTQYRQITTTFSTSLNSVEQNTAQIYPNPFANEFKISGINFKAGDEVNVYNVLGKQLVKIPVNQSTSLLNISAVNLESGIYFIQLKVGNKVISKKITKE